MNCLVPYALSCVIGYLLLKITVPAGTALNGWQRAALSVGFGLGVSSHITFYQLMIAGRVIPSALIIIMLAVIALLALIIHHTKITIIPSLVLEKPLLKAVAPFILIGLCIVPYLSTAQLYPLGGWDAWSVWNFKARFIFLAGEQWKNVFDPVLWRSSQHYPLFLPLTIVWGWALSAEPVDTVPLYAALLFGMATIGLLFGSILKYATRLPALLMTVCVATVPFAAIAVMSQYSDVQIAYYLLAGIACIIGAYTRQSVPLAALGGGALGFLTFTKPEGMIAAIVVALLSTVYLWASPAGKGIKKKLCAALAAGMLAASVPTIIFYAALRPEHQTFINGLFSSEYPTSLERLKIIGAFSAFELVSKKWSGIWVALFIGALIGHKRIFAKEIRIIPACIFSYAAIVCAYYFINTHPICADILWWLSISLARILFTLLPISALWIAYCTWGGAKGKLTDNRANTLINALSHARYTSTCLRERRQ